MLQTTITQCTSCNTLLKALGKVECTLLYLIRNKNNNDRFNTRLYFDGDLYKDLLRYKRIIERRFLNPAYPYREAQNQDIITRVTLLAFKDCECSECCPEPCEPPTTTTTTTTTAAPMVFTAYWGWKSGDDVLSESDIELSPYYGVFADGADVIADFTANGAPLYLWVAIPSEQPDRVEWVDYELNQNNVFNNTELFKAAQISGTYDFFITNYVTAQTQRVITFKS